MTNFQFVPVESSTIDAIGYDDVFHALFVRFRDGSVWKYSDVLPARHASFLAAESKGHFFANLIRGKYDEERMTSTPGNGLDKPKFDDHGNEITDEKPVLSKDKLKIGVDMAKPGSERTHVQKIPRPVAPVTRMGHIDV